ncbi:WXG100 family type VII secretion target [Propionibacterium acidifaciens]|uniref:WXG100 family type VII secretion target n=1 Tax=Propionibacterium acidifaciens TaxID=556499 RepID=UPI0028E328EA|nr:WXG100 family type VII secretion target [Propionibacterium acidifaciens]
MSGRVLSTEAAQNAITQIKSITDGGLTDQLNGLETQGQVLCDKSNWDGPLADKFSNETWPSLSSALKQMVEQINELQQQTQQISSDIFRAGGACADRSGRGGVARRRGGSGATPFFLPVFRGAARGRGRAESGSPGPASDRSCRRAPACGRPERDPEGRRPGAAPADGRTIVPRAPSLGIVGADHWRCDAVC